GSVPGIHVVLSMLDDVDGRDKPGHDEAEGDGRKTLIAICDSPALQGRVRQNSRAFRRPYQHVGDQSMMRFHIIASSSRGAGTRMIPEGTCGPSKGTMMDEGLLAFDAFDRVDR
uniref:hypothetical protein n=1 Tax=Bradyrhizobium sp. SZCCHNR2011 TaxID=3057376 RepID=UPI0028F04A4E